MECAVWLMVVCHSILTPICLSLTTGPYAGPTLKRIVANGQLEFVGAGEKRRRGKEGENIIFTLSWLCCSVCCSAVLVCGSTR